MNRNYTREAFTQYYKHGVLTTIPMHGEEDEDEFVKTSMRVMAKAHRFLVPLQGMSEDTRHSLIGVDELRLPYPEVTIEVTGIWEGHDPVAVYLIVAREMPESSLTFSAELLSDKYIGGFQPRKDGKEGTAIQCSFHVFHPIQKKWVLVPAIGFILRRSIRDEATYATPTARPVVIKQLGTIMSEEMRNCMQQVNDFCIPHVLDLCAVLNCSNASFKKVAGSKVRAAMQSKKALPSDDYFVVTISATKIENNTIVEPSGGHGTHRSPREHLRRGHIRMVRCGPGRSETRPVWVNSMVVNPGAGGKIYKDYEVVEEELQ